MMTIEIDGQPEPGMTEDLRGLSNVINSLLIRAI